MSDKTIVEPICMNPLHGSLEAELAATKAERLEFAKAIVDHQMSRVGVCHFCEVECRPHENCIVEKAKTAIDKARAVDDAKGGGA